MHATIPVCPSCNSDNSIIHWGKRELKNKTVKRFFCKKCGKTFSNQLLKYTMYSPTVILSAISTYNLGYTIRQTRALINNRYKCRTTPSTIHLWLARYKDLCTFTNKLRRRYQLNPYSLLYSKKLYHQQVYEFKYHTLKLNLAGKTFPTLRNYIRAIPRDCPHSAFLSGPRCSGLRVNIKPERSAKNNNASKLAELALTLARTPRERH
ncbi:MAG: IS1 family transposase, partial [Thermoplasmata archaeon]|nr:IS1 family transposase [Thermoplasmata archaeon]